MERVIVWNKRPSKFLAKVLKKISEDSHLQAERVEDEVLKAINGIIRNPERYPRDKFNKKNLGNCRAFEIMSLRVAYKLTPTQIRILRIRHVKQEPMDY
jgi:plasmid stabilization system protein ParE